MEKTTAYQCPYCKKIFKTDCVKHEQDCKWIYDYTEACKNDPQKAREMVYGER